MNSRVELTPWRTLGPVLLTVVTIPWAPSIAVAAEPCPVEAREDTYGPLEASKAGVWYYTEIEKSYPCEVVHVQFSAQTNGAGVTFKIDLIGGSGVSLTTESSLTCSFSCSSLVPPGDDSAAWRNTLGEAGRIKAVRVMVAGGTLVDPIPQYRLRIRRRPRPGFNLGGAGFADALPLTERPRTLFTSLSPHESGQYFSVSLAPGETLRVSGVGISAHTSGARLHVDVHDVNLARVTPDRPFALGHGETPFRFAVFTNTSKAMQLFFLRVRIEAGHTELILTVE
jgi:hypothetical protein